MSEFGEVVTEDHARMIESLELILGFGDHVPVDRRDALEAGIRSLEELVEKQGVELVVRPGCMQRYLLEVVRLGTILASVANPMLGGMTFEDLTPQAAPYIEQLRAQGDDSGYQVSGVLDIERFANAAGSA